jgi:hypothetical protein
VRLFIALLAASLIPAAATAKTPTFYKDVLPVLQKNCQECHRAGEAAPMQFFTYQQTRPWAKAMKEAVISRRMPPWYADPHVGKFTNDRSLSKADIDTLVAWAESGAKEGKQKDAPPARTFADGWAIGAPDVVYELPEPYVVPAKGTIQYTYYIVPTGFTEDRWIQMAEARPGDRSVVHHIIAFIREPGSKWMKDYPAGKAFVPKRGGGEGDGGMGGQFMTGYAPGAPPEVLRPGQAKLVKAGSDVVFQMHYTASGKEATDRSRVGMIFAKEKPAYKVLTLAAANNKFVIPPGAAAHKVDGAITLHADSELVSLLPHMHLRGKSMEIRAVYPTGEVEKLVWVPNYDFNWQLWYQLPPGKIIPKGTRIEATGTFDNSANNKYNPDPNVEVRYGDQSWEEMMIGFFDLSIPVDMNPMDLLRAPKKPASATGSGGE